MCTLVCLCCQPVEEPEKMTEIIFQALEITGQRGIINKGWGGLGDCTFSLCPEFHSCQYICISNYELSTTFSYNILSSVAEPKDFIYLLDNCPHDWLFSRCAAVVSHLLSPRYSGFAKLMLDTIPRSDSAFCYIFPRFIMEVLEQQLLVLKQQ